MASASSGWILVDTNVLVYAVDAAEGSKSEHAVTVVEVIADARAGIVNNQVIAEFYAVATRSRSGGSILSPGDAARWAGRWLAIFEFRPITELVVHEALRGARDHQMNIFDAQIWASAKIGDIGLVLTEDTQSAETLEGVRYVDPFAANFKLTQIGL